MGLGDHVTSVFRRMHRKRKMRSNDMETKLNRCLSAFELSFIGLSLMVSGIFVVTSSVIHNMAGPGIVISYVLAGTAAILSAFSYAEMGSRVPRAGSSYVYASIALGEIWGFLAGWNMILEYVLVSAAMSRSFTSTLVLAAGGHNVSDALAQISFEVLGQKTDLVAAAIVLVFAIIVGLGVRLTAAVNVTFNIIAMLLVTVVSGFCFGHGDISNWNKHGLDTFFPHGAAGVTQGAATCYFSYIGFEAITVSGEESLNPKKSVPIAILLAFLMATFCYVFSSLAFTYLAGTSSFLPDLPLSAVFFDRGMNINGFTISLAGLLSVSTNIIVGLYAVPRVFYAMACDGLVFKWLGIINKTTQTPVIAMLVSGAMVALVTYFLEMSTLVEAVSIGTLSSYVLVAIGVLILRYQPDREDTELKPPGTSTTNDLGDDLAIEAKSTSKSDQDPIITHSVTVKPGQRKAWVQDYTFLRSVWPDVHPTVAILWMTFFIFLLALTEMIALKLRMFASVWNILLASALVLPILFWILHLLLYEQNKPDEGTFRMPLMPLVPAISIWMNIQFMLMLSWITWVRLAVWVTIGFIIYFGYGIRHSQNEEERALKTSDQVTYGTNGDVIPTEEATPVDTTQTIQ